MIVRALAALLFLAFAAAPAMACCAHASAALAEAAAGRHQAHDAGTPGVTTHGDDAARPHDAAKATCVALAGLAAEPAAEIANPATGEASASFAAAFRTEGLSFGPTAPPPKAA